MRKGTLWHFRANMRFLNNRVALHFKSTPLKTFWKILTCHRVMIVSVTPSRYDFLLALWNFPCLCNCCWRFISALLRTLFFELFFFFFFDRPLAANASLCQCTGTQTPLKPELKKTHVDDYWCAAQTYSHNTCDISSAPLSSDGLERRIWQRRYLDPGVDLLANTIGGVRAANSLACILDQQRPPRTLRDHVQSASALSALKKSLVTNLSAKRQHSVAKLSAKRNVLLAKRDFLVANGRMAADFSSPEKGSVECAGECPDTV